MTIVTKKVQRMRRSRRTRARIRLQRALRLSVHRTLQHIYVQAIDVEGKVLAVASTREKSLQASGSGSNITAAERVGTAIAERLVQKGLTKVAFDRSGNRYHGRVKALADAARAGGLEF